MENLLINCIYILFLFLLVINVVLYFFEKKVRKVYIYSCLIVFIVVLGFHSVEYSMKLNLISKLESSIYVLSAIDHDNGDARFLVDKTQLTFKDNSFEISNNSYRPEAKMYGRFNVNVNLVLGNSDIETGFFSMNQQ